MTDNKSFNKFKAGQSLHHRPRHTYVKICFEFKRFSKIGKFESAICTGVRLVPGSDFVLGLRLKVSVRAFVNKKQRTRNQHDTDAFLSHHAQLVSPKTAGHSIFGHPSDIKGGIIRTDPS